MQSLFRAFGVGGGGGSDAPVAPQVAEGLASPRRTGSNSNRGIPGERDAPRRERRASTKDMYQQEVFTTEHLSVYEDWRKFYQAYTNPSLKKEQSWTSLLNFTRHFHQAHANLAAQEAQVNGDGDYFQAHRHRKSFVSELAHVFITEASSFIEREIRFLMNRISRTEIILPANFASPFPANSTGGGGENKVWFLALLELVYVCCKFRADRSQLLRAQMFPALVKLFMKLTIRFSELNLTLIGLDTRNSHVGRDVSRATGPRDVRELPYLPVLATHSAQVARYHCFIQSPHASTSESSAHGDAPNLNPHGEVQTAAASQASLTHGVAPGLSGAIKGNGNGYMSGTNGMVSRQGVWLLLQAALALCLGVIRTCLDPLLCYSHSLLSTGQGSENQTGSYTGCDCDARDAVPVHEEVWLFLESGKHSELIESLLKLYEICLFKLNGPGHGYGSASTSAQPTWTPFAVFNNPHSGPFPERTTGSGRYGGEGKSNPKEKTHQQTNDSPIPPSVASVAALTGSHYELTTAVLKCIGLLARSSARVKHQLLVYKHIGLLGLLGLYM